MRYLMLSACLLSVGVLTTTTGFAANSGTQDKAQVAPDKLLGGGEGGMKKDKAVKPARVISPTDHRNNPVKAVPATTQKNSLDKAVPTTP
jgi:hypothetical protein